MNFATTLKSFKLLLVTALLTACGGAQTVAFVDIPRYMGLWYQIAANPAFFNEGLVGVTANYTLQEDGSVRVENKGYINELGGDTETIIGRATITDRSTNASLKVQFPGQPKLPFANYLIVILDDLDYQYAVVTDPFNATLFVLNRTPSMDEALYNNLISELEAMGINTAKLVRTPQPTSPE